MADSKSDNKENTLDASTEETEDADIHEVEEAMAAINEYYQETLEMRDEFRESVQRINANFRTIDACFNKQRRQVKKMKDVDSLVKDLKNNNYSSNPKASSMLKEMQSKIDETKKSISELGKSKRRTGSMFLRSVIGHVSVKFWNEGDRLHFKQEYNRFKETWAPILAVLPLFHLYFGFTLWVHQLFAFFLFYYYTSLAIRENILKVNGSRIEKWWIQHHYVTLVSAILFLLVDPGHPLITHSVAFCVNAELVWQGTVMLMQNTYQRKRHYTKKAMAKKTAMDVRTTEVIDENVTLPGMYRYLIPALFFTYIVQILIATSMLYVALAYSDEFTYYIQKIHTLGLAACWYTLGIGNATTLIKVLSRKKQLQLGKIINVQNLIKYAFFAQLMIKNLLGSAGGIVKSSRGLTSKLVIYALTLSSTIQKLIGKIMGMRSKSSKKKSSKHSSSKHSSSKKKHSSSKKSDKSDKSDKKDKESDSKDSKDSKDKKSGDNDTVTTSATVNNV